MTNDMSSIMPGGFDWSKWSEWVDCGNPTGTLLTQNGQPPYCHVSPSLLAEKKDLQWGAYKKSVGFSKTQYSYSWADSVEIFTSGGRLYERYKVNGHAVITKEGADRNVDPTFPYSAPRYVPVFEPYDPAVWFDPLRGPGGSPDAPPFTSWPRRVNSPGRDAGNRPEPVNSPRPVLSPGVRVVPVYNPATQLWDQVQAWPGYEHDGVTETPTVTYSPPVRRPPGPDTKEKKSRVTASSAPGYGFANAIGEAVDAIEAIWEAIPKEFRTKKKWVPPWFRHRPKPTPQEMLRDIWKHHDKINWNEAYDNLIENEIEDRLYGKLGKLGGRAGRRIGRPVGVGTGPALM